MPLPSAVVAVLFYLVLMSNQLFARDLPVPLTHWPDDHRQLTEQCDAVSMVFNTEFAAQPDEQTLMMLDQKLAHIDSTIAKAMVLVDAGSSPSIKAAALACVEQLSQLQAQWSSLDNVSVTLARLSEQRFSEQGSRLMSLWLLEKDLLSSARAQKASEMLTYAELGYQQTLHGLDKKLRLPERCMQGVPNKLLSQWQQTSQFELPLRGGQVAQYLNLPTPEQCRRMVWVALGSKGMPDNMVQLDMMLGQRHVLARLQGAEHWAAMQLQTQMLSDVTSVDRYLQQSFKNLREHRPQSQSTQDWLWSVTATRPQLADNAMVAPQVVAMVFNTLRNYGLRFEQLSDVGQRWHETVEAYHVYHDEQMLGTLLLDLHGRPGKSAKARHRAIEHGISGRHSATSAVLTSLPSTHWQGRERLVFYQQLGLAIQHLFARADYYGLSGASIEGDFSRLGKTLLPLIMKAEDPWLQSRTPSYKKLTQQYFRASTALAYHQLEKGSFVSLQQINHYYFKRYFELPMPDEYTPQYSLTTLVSDAALYHQRLWYPQFAAWLMSCEGAKPGALFAKLFQPAGRQSALSTVQNVCPKVGSLKDLVTQVASVQRLH